MKDLLMTACMLLVFTVTSAQVVNPSKPIVFGEIFTGITLGNSTGFALGTEVNLQSQASLFSARYMSMFNRRQSASSQNSASSEPTTSDEISALYGYRRIIDGHSWSLSAGISYVNFKSSYSLLNDSGNSGLNQQYLGFPIELNIKWFKHKSSGQRLFGTSFGLKFFGLIAKNSYAGLGIGFGIGSHTMR